MNKGIQKSQKYAEGFKNQDEYVVYVGFDYDWNIRVFVYDYFSLLDVVSQLGGLGATIKIVLTSASPLIIL